MTKILTIISIFLGILAFGQVVQIDTFRLTNSEQFKDIQLDKLYFPVVRTGDKKIDSLINYDLKNRFTGNEYPDETIDSALTKWADDQIVFLNFQLTYNQDGILSLHVSAEGCGAYCTGWTDYFNYSTLSGQWLEISDVIDTTSGLLGRIITDKKNQYTNQKEELKEMLKNPNSGLDESTYDWALDNYEDCVKNSEIESFAIYPNQLQIIEDCYLPNSIKHLTPIFELKYKFSDIKKYLKIKP